MKTPPTCRHCPAPASVLIAGIPLCEACYAAYDTSGDDYDANAAGKNADAYASPPCLAHEFAEDDTPAGLDADQAPPQSAL